ncbi:MAG TPA: tetratricopeptide repeat protein [Chitinophagales bacterium]|nr:tetratricopeptide repeat protein [Chitinophagales bacterium]
MKRLLTRFHLPIIPLLLYLCFSVNTLAQDYNYYNYGEPDTADVLKPSKKEKKKKKKNSTAETPFPEYNTPEEEEKAVLKKPSGFDMYGSDVPDNNFDPANPYGTEPKQRKKKEKQAKTGKQNQLQDNSPDVINLDLSALYQVNFTDTVIVEDKRKKSKEPTEISFKAKEDVKYYYNQAVLKLNNSNYEAAIELLDKCLARDPTNKDALQMRANCYTELKKYKQALKDYNRAVKLDAADPILQYNKATTLLKMGKLNDAIETFDVAVNYKPDYIFALQGRASAKTINGDYAGAIEDYSLVLDQNPLFIAALKGRGVAKGLLRRYDDAVNDFSAVIELQSSDGMAYYYRGLAYISLNQPFKGCSDFDRAYQLNVKQAYFDIKEYCR